MSLPVTAPKTFTPKPFKRFIAEKIPRLKNVLPTVSVRCVERFFQRERLIPFFSLRADCCRSVRAWPLPANSRDRQISGNIRFIILYNVSSGQGANRLVARNTGRCASTDRRQLLSFFDSFFTSLGFSAATSCFSLMSAGILNNSFLNYFIYSYFPTFRTYFCWYICGMICCAIINYISFCCNIF